MCIYSNVLQLPFYLSALTKLTSTTSHTKTEQITVCACAVPPVLLLGLGPTVWEVLECMLLKVVEVIEPTLVVPVEAWWVLLVLIEED